MPGPHRRHVYTGTDTSGAVPVDYRFRHSRNGIRHLVVVFANYDAPDDYGWSNGVLDQQRANVLWIRDQFDGHRSYYLCRDTDFAIEQSVLAVLHRFLDMLSLTPADCTLLGSSKGGTAALRFGLAHGFGNIVAVAPQFAIGSYVRDLHPRTARYMMGGPPSDDAVAELDALLPDTVRGTPHTDANIYVFSAVSDAQYRTQIKPHLMLFERCTNFNFVLSESVFVPDHTQVARRNVPAVLGLLNLLTDGMAPRIGFARNGFEDPQGDRSAVEEYLAATSDPPRTWVPRPRVTTPPAGQRSPGAALRFAGTAHNAKRVHFWEDGRRLGDCPVRPDGSWSWTPGHAWPKGPHTVRVFAQHADGAESERTDVVVTVLDTLRPPEVTVPGDGAPVPVDTLRIEGRAPGAERVQLWEHGRQLGEAGVTVDGSWTWRPTTPMAAGEHIVKAFAVDRVGTETARTEARFTAASTAANA
ncbi:hypothetical protein [Streptomyces sp. Je 1-332]|uniref:hypothetical protein n=1 Tax=Streptomyces sp. Je 1-332 TaxID=3231270 RepID=UPI00345A25FE